MVMDSTVLYQALSALVFHKSLRDSSNVLSLCFFRPPLRRRQRHHSMHPSPPCHAPFLFSPRPRFTLRSAILKQTLRRPLQRHLRVGVAGKVYCNTRHSKPCIAASVAAFSSLHRPPGALSHTRRARTWFPVLLTTSRARGYLRHARRFLPVRGPKRVRPLALSTRSAHSPLTALPPLAPRRRF